jgi:hypothetical protein
MIVDVDLNNLAILPKDHISLKHYDYAVSVDKKNKVFEKVIFGLITAGVLSFIYYLIKEKDESNKKK